MCNQCDLDKLELLRLKHENGALRSAVQRAFCGAVLDEKVSCQLSRGHHGTHAWAEPASNLMIQWSDDPKEQVRISWSSEDSDR
jgi:hypothetical protein